MGAVKSVILNLVIIVVKILIIVEYQISINLTLSPQQASCYFVGRMERGSSIAGSLTCVGNYFLS